jgi:hypothetical protein
VYLDFCCVKCLNEYKRKSKKTLLIYATLIKTGKVNGQRIEEHKPVKYDGHELLEKHSGFALYYYIKAILKRI